MKKCIVENISKVTGLTQELVNKVTVRSQDLQHGDYAFPCFVLSKNWGLNPAECATKLSQLIQLDTNIERVQNIGPYLNFYLKRDLVVKDILAQKAIKASTDSKGKIILDFSAPNIAKPFHIGHLRTTLIGHSLSRIYRQLGYQVISINHLGDWGTQFGFVYAGCKLWGRPSDSEASVEKLVDLYKQASALRKDQEASAVDQAHSDIPNVNLMARDYFIRLEAGDKEALDFWQWCLDISLIYFKDIYQRLGVTFDYYTGESFYRDKLADVEKLIKDSGLLENSEGALGINLGKKLGFARILTEDGRSLYLTRDLATADYREKTFQPDKILYVVGAPQSLHFQQLIQILKLVKHPCAEKIVHIAFGHVPGMSTRSSPAQTEANIEHSTSEQRLFLKDLLDEACERALEAYTSQLNKERDIANQSTIAEYVGLGAIYFSFLSRSNIKDFHFKWEDALRFQGDTGPYLQYAVARLNSIEKKAAECGFKLDHNIDFKILAEDDSYQLIKLLDKFQETLEKAALESEPYHIAQYLLELAKAFSSAYDKLRVIGAEPETAKARLLLFRAIKEQLINGLYLLGINSVDSM